MTQPGLLIAVSTCAALYVLFFAAIMIMVGKERRGRRFLVHGTWAITAAGAVVWSVAQGEAFPLAVFRAVLLALSALVFLGAIWLWLKIRLWGVERRQKQLSQTQG